MNNNITPTMNTTLFTARVTEDVPPRLSVEFGQGNSFQKDGGPCSAKVTVNANRQIRVHLGNKTVVNEAAGNLALPIDCGQSLVLRQASHNSYDYVHTNEDAEGVNLSQVTLRVQGAGLFAKFEAGGAAAAAPVVPMMPGATAPAPVGQAVGGVNAPANVQGANKYAILAAKLKAGEIPSPKLSSMVAPNAPAPAPVVAVPQPPVKTLRGDLPRETFSNKRLTGTLYKDYKWYKDNPNPPTDAREKAAYDLQYPIFLREEALYAALQERLKAIAAQTTLSYCLPQSELLGPSFDLRYQYQRRALPSATDYAQCLNKEKDYLSKQEQNTYNSAS